MPRIGRLKSKHLFGARIENFPRHSKLWPFQRDSYMLEDDRLSAYNQPPAANDWESGTVSQSYRGHRLDSSTYLIESKGTVERPN